MATPLHARPVSPTLARAHYTAGPDADGTAKPSAVAGAAGKRTTGTLRVPWDVRLCERSTGPLLRVSGAARLILARLFAFGGGRLGDFGLGLKKRGKCLT